MAAKEVVQWHLRQPNPKNPVVFFGACDPQSGADWTAAVVLEKLFVPSHEPDRSCVSHCTDLSNDTLICTTDISIGGLPAGRVKMELFADVAPKTAENFRQFCTGEHR